MAAFKPNPKKNDIEERAVLSLNNANAALVEFLKKLDTRPSETHLERRLYLGTAWSDWKKVA